MFGFPDPKRGGSTTVFQSPGSWRSWRKPPGALFVHIFLVGGGGGGGGGGTYVNATTAVNGGGSGASGYLMNGLFYAPMLPDELFVYVGAGGAGGAAGLGTGGNGEASTVSLTEGQAGAGYALMSAGGGGGAAGATGGTAGAVVISTSSVIRPLFIPGEAIAFNTARSFVAGHAGRTGISSGYSNFDQWASSPYGPTSCGGAGGGVTNSNTAHFGQTLAPTGFPSRQRGATQGAAGEDGIYTLAPFWSSGGAGGTARTSGNSGGRGGHGAPGGSGGGGGGVGTPGGVGGDGGPGIVVIACTLGG